MYVSRGGRDRVLSSQAAAVRCPALCGRRESRRCVSRRCTRAVLPTRLYHMVFRRGNNVDPVLRALQSRSSLWVDEGASITASCCAAASGSLSPASGAPAVPPDAYIVFTNAAVVCVSLRLSLFRGRANRRWWWKGRGMPTRDRGADSSAALHSFPALWLWCASYQLWPANFVWKPTWAKLRPPPSDYQRGGKDVRKRQVVNHHVAVEPLCTKNSLFSVMLAYYKVRSRAVRNVARCTALGTTLTLPMVVPSTSTCSVVP